MATANSNIAIPSRVLSFVDSCYWAMHRPAYQSLRAIIEARCLLPHAGPVLSRTEKDAAIEAAQAARTTQTYIAPTTIAVMNMFGVISPRMGMMDDLSQEGCTLDSFGARYRQAMTDPNIAGVVVNADSPGGNVYQVQETADLIYSLRDMKPNVIVGTGMVASAAFWLGSQFSGKVASPSSEWGSIGVIMRHEDISKMLDEIGVVETYITAPKDSNKAEGNPFTPISDDTIDFYFSRCNEYYQMFLSALSRGSGVKTKVIDQDWGRGRMLGAKAALSLGMVDRIGTLQGEIDRMAQKLSKKSGTRADSGDREFLVTGEMIGDAESAAGLGESIVPEAATSAEPVDDPNRRAIARARLELAGA